MFVVRKLRKIFLYFVTSVYWTSIVSADMVRNDDKYLLNNEEYIEALDLIEACCYQFGEEYKAQGGLVADQNYRFPLKDGRELIMIMEDYGAHTFWYRLFVSGPNSNLYMALLDVPPEEDMSWYTYVDGDRIFNPTFDLEKQQLVAWNFGRSGQLKIRLTYEYIRDSGPDFKLKKLEEDNIDNDLSDYNVEINY